LLVACAYLGLGTVFHTGLSGTAPLIIATPDNFLLKTGILSELIPTSRTLFTPFNLLYALCVGLLGILIVAALVPPAGAAVTVSVEHADRLAAANAVKAKPAVLIPAERIEWWPGWSLIVGGAMLGYFALQVRTLGLGKAWTINNYNLLFLALGL